MQDLELDIPDAAHFVALFLGRAIVDEVLPPAFLTKVLQRLRDDSLGVQVVRSVGELALHQTPACSSSAVIGTNRLVECYMLRSKFSEFCAVHDAWMTNAVSSCQLTRLN